MNPDEVIANLQSLITEYQNKAAFFQVCIDLYKTGYKSDQDYIAAQIQAGVAPLEAQVTDLQGQLTVQQPEQPVDVQVAQQTLS